MFSLFNNVHDQENKKQQELFLLNAPPKIQLEPVNYSKVMFKQYANTTPTQLVSTNKFYENFDLTSGNLFLCVDWRNMVVAGGSITALSTKSEISDNDFSDFDIFFYGLTPRECNRKLIELYNSFKQVHSDILVVRTSRTITFCFGRGRRYIQVITNVYDTVQSVLNNFDVNCCCVAFDGEQIYTIERGYKAIMRRANTFDLSCGSYAYEYRLAKYGYRGYVLEYQYDNNKVDNNIYSRDNKQLHGLAKLISLEKISTKSKFNIYCDVLDYHQASMRRNLNTRDCFKYNDESGYGGKFMPEWSDNKTNEEIKTMCLSQNAKYKFSVFQVGELNELLLGKPLVVLPEDATEFMKTNIVNGKVNWSNQELFTKRDKVDFEEWCNQAYNENPKLEQILNAIKNKRNVELRNLCNGVDLNVRNVVSNTPVSAAILSDNLEALEIVNLAGARLDFVSKLKKTPIHTAVEIGNLEAVKYILNNMPNAIDFEDSYKCTPLIYSIIYGRSEIFKYLYKLNPISPIVWTHSHSKINYYGLQMCLYYERYDIAEYLLDVGYDINDHDKSKHILQKCIERHNLHFLFLLFGHVNSYKLKYSKAEMSAAISKIIRHIEYAFFKFNYAHFVVEYMKLDTSCENLLESLFRSVITHMSEEDTSAFFEQHSVFLKQKINVDVVRTIITDLINVNSEKTTIQNQQNYKLCFDSTENEIYVPPRWCIDTEIEAYKGSKSKNNFVKYNPSKCNHYKNIRLILSKYFTHLLPKYELSTGGNVETIVIKNVIVPKNNKKSRDYDSEDEPEAPKKSIKTTIKNSEIEKVKMTELQVLISTTAKPSNLYFQLFDKICNSCEITQEELENCDLTSKLTNSHKGFLTFADETNNSNVYITVMNLLLTQTIGDKPKYKVNSQFILNIIKSSSKFLNLGLELLVKHKLSDLSSYCFDIIDALIYKDNFCEHYAILKPAISKDKLQSNIDLLLLHASEYDNYVAFNVLLNEVSDKKSLQKCLIAMSHSKKQVSTMCIDTLVKAMGDKNNLHYVSRHINPVFDHMLNSCTSLIGSTALHNACEAKCFDNVKALVTKFYADIDEQDERGYSALMIAIKSCDKQTFEYLLERGASTNIKDNYGNTPLHIAILHTFIVAVKALQPHNIENNFRMTPQDYINNMVKSYFYHARTNKTIDHQLGYVTTAYNNFSAEGLERVYANIESVNRTIHDILDKINNGSQMSDLI